MRIKTSSKRAYRRKIARKKKVEGTKDFSDIIEVGDEEEKADLTDIQELPGTRGRGESILSAKGEFIYDIDFVIDAEDAILDSVTAVQFVIYKERPKKRARISDRSQKSIRESFKRKKRRRSKRPTSDAVQIRSKRNLVISHGRVSLGPEFVKSADLKRYLEKINAKLIKDIAPKEEVVISTSKPSLDSQQKNVKVTKATPYAMTDNYLTRMKSKSGVAAKESSSRSDHNKSKKIILKEMQKTGYSPMNLGWALHPVVPQFLGSSRDSHATSNRKKSGRVHTKVRKTTVKATKRGRSVSDGKAKPHRSTSDSRAAQAQRSLMNKLRRKKSRIEDELGEIKFKTRMIAYSLSLGVDMTKAGSKDKLVMKVQLIHDRDRRGQYKYFDINHREQLDEMLTPDDRPDISIGVMGRKPSEVRIRISQNDDIATSVTLMRRKITDDEADPEYEFMEIADIEVHSETGSASYIDNSVTNVHPNSYEYRVFPVGPTGSEAPEHSNAAIIKGIMPIGHAASSYTDPDNNIAISAINMYDRIGLSIESIPDDVVAIRLFKEDLKSDSFFSNSESRFKPVIPPEQTSSIINVGKGVTSIKVEDVDVVPNHTYKYKCVLRRPRQSEAEGNEEEIITHLRPRVRTPVEAKIENTKVDFSYGRATVSFDLVAEFSDPGLEVLGEIFAASGISGNFIEDIRKNRDQLESVPAFLVSRIDLYTGRSVRLGVFSPGEFHDDEKLQKKTRHYIRPGRKYRYIAQLALRPPEAFFKNALTSVDVQGKGVLDLKEEDRYEVLAQRFMSGFGATSGLPSEADLKNMTEMGVEGQFELGRTGIELDHVVLVPKKRARVVKARVRQKKRFNSVEWVTEGNTFDINFFIIVLHYKGMQGTIGTIPARRSKYNIFRDKMYYQELGEMSYSIIPVYNSMRTGKPIQTNKISRDRSVSSSWLDRLMARKVSESETE